MDPLKIGNVIAIQNGSVKVVLTVKDLELEHEGRVYRVGQLGSYITIPMKDRTLVGFVTGAGREDITVIDVEPELVMQVQLLGEIREDGFKRGVNEYPIIGDEVWVAIHDDFECIFGSFEKILAGTTHSQSFTLGKFAYDTSYDVKILGSEFFAKHVSLLGNSGSGKSCTTARILQEVLDLNQSQVIMFDMHGEYRAAFSDDDNQIHANVTYLGTDDLVLPYWLLKYEEIEALFVDRSNPINISTQISFLRSALLEFKEDAAKGLGLIKTLTLDTPIYFDLEMLKIYAENLNDARYVLNDDRLAFSQLALRSLMPEEQQVLMRTQRCQFNRGNPEGETPHPLFFGKLLGLIDLIETKLNDRRYAYLLRPVEHGMHSKFFRDFLSHSEGSAQTSNVMNHLIKLMTGRVEPRSNMTIIDLSGIPFEIVDITVAVLTRLIFDLNFWTPPKTRHPTLLVYEEAHNYIPRVDIGAAFAKKAVERVAKEGRKYGVSAMIVSQRPSELSETVLSQCNSFVIMRISNPDDQKYVTHIVGEQFAGVIEMLPVMRPGEAFVIGDSVLMPMRTLVTPPDPWPQSGDVDYFKIWAQDSVEGDIDDIIDHWRRQDRQIVDSGEDEVHVPPPPIQPPSMQPPTNKPPPPIAPPTPVKPDEKPGVPKKMPVPSVPGRRWLVS